MSAKINKTVVLYFWVYDQSTPVSGLADSQFQKIVLFNGSPTARPLTVYEVNADLHPGLYRGQLVPNILGYWYIEIKHSSYTTNPDPAGLAFECVPVDLADIYQLILHTPPGDMVLVGTDYGGADNLRYIDRHGTGIPDGEVRAYLKTDYDSGNLGASYIKSSSRTDINGRLSAPLVLSPNYWYKIVYVVPGRQPDVKELFVSRQ